ncbi:MAG: hypothetical protein K8R36_15555 [Planctomycetales bacterium]|nr:hypothetical protein [Planctomycetales bacterium]
MLHSSLLRRAIPVVALLLMVGADVVAQAEQPFFYYPAYGSSRGKIRYVDGVFRNKQKIHWGNGVTNNGVMVMHDAFAAAAQIIPAVITHKDAEQSDAEKRAATRDAESAAAGDREEQAKADSILKRNQELLERLGGGSTESPSNETPGVRKDKFEDWSDSAPPHPPGPRKDEFKDWPAKP